MILVFILIIVSTLILILGYNIFNNKHKNHGHKYGQNRQYIINYGKYMLFKYNIILNSKAAAFNNCGLVIVVDKYIEFGQLIESPYLDGLWYIMD